MHRFVKRWRQTISVTKRLVTKTSRRQTDLAPKRLGQKILAPKRHKHTLLILDLILTLNLTLTDRVFQNHSIALKFSLILAYVFTKNVTLTCILNPHSYPHTRLACINKHPLRAIEWRLRKSLQLPRGYRLQVSHSQGPGYQGNRPFP